MKVESYSSRSEVVLYTSEIRFILVSPLSHTKSQGLALHRKKKKKLREDDLLVDEWSYTLKESLPYKKNQYYFGVKMVDTRVTGVRVKEMVHKRSYDTCQSTRYENFNLRTQIQT